MNLINKHLGRGLGMWSKKGAEVKYLKRGGLSVPEILIPSVKSSKKLFILVSGFHLEETSGPIFLLNPSLVLPSLRPVLRNTNVLILPVINQRGLKFKETAPDKYLRYSRDGINYNSTWGSKSKKPDEILLVEKEVLKLFEKYQIVFVHSMHEDSTEPGNAYLWMNRIRKKERKIIQDRIENSSFNKMLKMNSTVGFREGQIERGFTIIDAKDSSFENFMSEILGIPTLLSEAPYGLDLKTRINFHKACLKALIPS